MESLEELGITVSATCVNRNNPVECVVLFDRDFLKMIQEQAKDDSEHVKAINRYLELVELSNNGAYTNTNQWYFDLEDLVVMVAHDDIYYNIKFFKLICDSYGDVSRETFDNGRLYKLFTASDDEDVAAIMKAYIDHEDYTVYELANALDHSWYFWPSDELLYKAENKIIETEGGDWIDLRAAEDVELHAPKVNKETGEIEFHTGMFKLDMTCRLPLGHEAIVASRSSTFKKWGFILQNGIGIIDNSYCGDNDQWRVPFIAYKNANIKKGDRVLQFKIVKNQGEFHFNRTSKLFGEDRGGFGSTGHE